jgi:hypothetical protein
MVLIVFRAFLADAEVMKGRLCGSAVFRRQIAFALFKRSFDSVGSAL